MSYKAAKTYSKQCSEEKHEPKKVCNIKDVQCCAPNSDVRLEKHLVSVEGSNSALSAVNYNLVLVNNTCQRVKNVLLSDSFGLVDGDLTVTLPSNLAASTVTGELTDPCNSCLEPCSVTVVQVRKELSGLLAGTTVRNVVVLEACLLDKVVRPSCPCECKPAECDDCCGKREKLRPVVNSEVLLEVPRTILSSP